MHDILTNDGLPVQLETQDDYMLRDVIDRARQILLTRDQVRKQEAIATIQRIAKEHGLDIAVKKPGRKRGRPPKPNAPK